MTTVDYAERVQGGFTILPPLNNGEAEYLHGFAGARHMDRELGPYYIGSDRADVLDINSPAPDQPSLWCHWEPDDDGAELVWNGAEKFRYPEKWLAYILGTFLAPDSKLSRELADRNDGRYYSPEFEDFTFDHDLIGISSVVMEDGFTYQIKAEGGSVYVLDRGREFQITDTSRPMRPTAAARRTLRALLVGGPEDGQVVVAELNAMELGIPSSTGDGVYWHVPGTREPRVVKFEFRPATQ